jgi:hypothetical protein
LLRHAFIMGIGNDMAAKKRPYKKEYQKQLERGEHDGRMERQRARRAMDAKGIDRTGKDVSHKKMIKDGGKNSDGVTLEAPSKNRARNGESPAKKKAAKKK